MRFIKFLGFSLLILMLFQSCKNTKHLPIETANTIQVTHLDQLEAPKDSSLIYALPQTRLVFKIRAIKTIKKTGPFYRYSERFIGIKDVIIKDEEIYSIQSIKLEALSEPDPDHYYAVNFSGKDFVPPLHLTEDGCIISYNAKPESNEAEIEIIKEGKKTEDTSFKYTPYLEDQVVVNSTAKMAEEAANFIYRIRENRVALVSGELDYFPADGQALTSSLKEMDKLEREFLSLFIGKETTEEEVYYIDYLPETEVMKTLFFRFSQFKGLVDKTDLSGSPYYLSLKLKTDNIQTIDAQSNVVNKGLYYRIPATAHVKISDGTNTIFKQEAAISQFGSVLSLPGTLLTTPGVGVVFYEKSGALKKIIKHN